MHVWADRCLVREGLTDTVTFDQSFERNERESPMLCVGMLFQAEGKPSTES